MAISHPELFLDRSNDRVLPPGYTGDIFLWDIDKTYLDTRFSSLRGLLAIPFEFALDKRPVPGAVPVLQGLRHGPGEESLIAPLYFLSGSPPQLRRVLEKRMTMDGVQFDGITFKDQYGLLKARRGGDIREQMGYKLLSLLLYWQELPKDATWFLFGDDVESDADVFSVFGEVCAGLRGAALERLMVHHRVSPENRYRLAELAEALPIASRNPVAQIFILRVRGSEGAWLSRPAVVASRSYLQTALWLLHLGRVQPSVLERVVEDMRGRGVSSKRLVADLRDAEERFPLSGHVWQAAAELSL